MLDYTSFSLTWVALMKTHHTTGGVSVAFVTGILYKSDNIYSSVFVSRSRFQRALKFPELPALIMSWLAA